MLNQLLPRAAAITAGALLGLTTLLAAAPAQADGPTTQTDITGTPECNTATGEWTVTWVVTNNWTEQAKVDKLTTTPAPVPGLENGTYLNNRSRSGTVGRTIFQQILTGSPLPPRIRHQDGHATASVTLGDGLRLCTRSR